jgi:hypothetical protein
MAKKRGGRSGKAGLGVPTTTLARRREGGRGGKGGLGVPTTTLAREEKGGREREKGPGVPLGLSGTAECKESKRCAHKLSLW